MTAKAEPIDRIPRPMLFAIGALLLATLAATAWFRWSERPPQHRGPVAESAAERAAILIREQAGGGTLILDPASGAEIARLAEGTDGFVRGVLRALEHVRDRHGVAHGTPIELLRWPNGHMALVDPATEWRAELIGFGADNLATFATLMSATVDTGEARE